MCSRANTNADPRTYSYSCADTDAPNTEPNPKPDANADHDSGLHPATARHAQLVAG